MSRNDPSPLPSRRALRLGVLTLALLATGIVVAGLSDRRSQATVLQARAEALAVPTVAVVQPERGAAGQIDLPGRIEAHARAPIYARISGYLRQWHVDIGTPVKTGQLLAEIETPELDQQLLQAQAELNTALGNAALADSTARRWQSLLATDSVSRQEAEEKAGDLAAKRSIVNALRANVERLQALKRFSRIVAPFDGVVTARTTDVGALIGAGGAPGTELFVVSDMRRLRVHVQVPQRHVAALGTGSIAQVRVPEHPDRTFSARVQSTAKSIHPGSGGMLMQLSVENAAGALLPGSHANVSFMLPADPSVLSVPPSALLFGKAGVRVATVDPEHKVVFKPVKIVRDLGTRIELVGSLAPNERVIDSPPDGLEQGDSVRLALREPAP